MRVALVLNEVFTGLRRNLSMVVSVILVTAISLTFVGAAILLQSQIQQMKGFWYDRAQVGVYLCSPIDASETCSETAATEEQIAAITAQLESPTLAPYVDAIAFESREEVYERFIEQFAGTASAEFATAENMNEVIWVTPSNPENADVVKEATSGMPGVMEVRDQRALLDPIFQVLNTASLGAVGVAVLMLIAAVLLISTTIRLSAFSRKRELGIMRLVGASNRFIRTPFILEGIVSALIGSVLAALSIIAIVQFFVQGYVQPRLQSTALIRLEDALLVAPLLIAIGVGLAGIAAAVAIRRYLKV
ncbi:permease-like cell division protein FtsX [Humidisolicoccus flavus]|uniref:permease-like cell division protein FtsX n=1 Tax=Humidisolicoccus flavus TaxID=3111414 RepID=UPI003251D0ED